jgi:FAD/FMN-containing dehydrogenase
MLPPVPLHTEPVTSYSRVHSANMLVARPTGENDLRALLSWANQVGRHLTLRGGGQSLHNQSMNDDGGDVAIAFSNMPRQTLQVDTTKQTITVEGWRTWGDIMRACLQQGYVPFVTVSSSRITAAGSLSADGLSRVSPIAGKESTAVRSIVVLLPNGDKRTIYHPRVVAAGTVTPDQMSAVDNEELFRAVVAGYGLIGIILNITYYVMKLDGHVNAQDRWRIATLIETIESGDEIDHNNQIGPMPGYQRILRRMDRALEDLRAALLPPAPGPGDFPPSLPPVVDPQYRFPYGAAFFVDPLGGKLREVGWEALSWFTTDNGKPFFAYDRDALVGPLKFGIKGLPRIAPLVETVIQARMAMADGDIGYNPIEDFTFFFEAHTVAMEEIVASGDLRQRALQQTFAISANVGTDATPSDTKLMADFMRDTRALFRAGFKRGVRKLHTWPNVVDVLYIPAGDGFLSASRNLDGFALTFGIEGLDADFDFNHATGVLKKIAKLCASPKYNGRVHLTKNVFAEPSDIGAMYAEGLPKWAAVKSKYDPKRVLSSDFYDDVLQPAALAINVSLP